MTVTETAPTNTAASDTNVTTSAPSGQGGARPKPVYKAEKVTELPQDLTLPRSGPRTDPAFIEALQVAQADPGEFYCVATFQSANGARTLLKRITHKDAEGKPDPQVKIPAGDWDFEARRIEAPGSTADKPVRWSKLFAKYMG